MIKINIRYYCFCLPEFSVTGMIGAVGQTTFKCEGLTSAKLDAHPWPVSPNPCKNINVAVCFPLADTTTGLPLIVFSFGLYNE